MRQMQKRLKALENRTSLQMPVVDLVFRNLVRPGEAGSADLGVHFATLVSGVGAGERLVREDGETELAFLERIERRRARI